ncbi:MAG TPA: sulfur oxidation c-type cytochrome SoxA [Paucimonas sp.]|nr:sulfur oxidation c-type cytochrome SoxA [Paucimonas sp.]
MRLKRIPGRTGIAAAAMCAASAALAQSAADEIAKYRQMLADDNPAELAEMKGAELWKTPRGPKKASLERCDLGLGPGLVKGAYTQLPRYFADTDRVQDLESRLVTCMTTLQGWSEAEARKNPFGANSDMQALVAYIASQSKGMRMAVPMAHPKEREAYAVGKRIFFYRAGTHDFACATCHAAPDLRIRLQNLPNLLDKQGAQLAYTTWPAYRVSQGEVRTMQHRLWDCFRQQRFPDAQYTSEAITALTTYLAKNADGGIFNAPALKR